MLYFKHELSLDPHLAFKGKLIKKFRSITQGILFYRCLIAYYLWSLLVQTIQNNNLGKTNR